MTAPPVDLPLESSWANASVWDREYRDARAIPSSHRVAPSHALTRLLPRLHLAIGASVLDAGSGAGRHAMLLAGAGMEVHAVDASRVACELLADRSDRVGVSMRVDQAVLGDDDLPDAMYDVILDSYVSCHILDPVARLDYLDALLGRLCPGGRLYTSCMGSGDAYYRTCAERDRQGSSLATDPLNGITKLLRSKNSFVHDLTELSPLVDAVIERFEDTVDGSAYQRQVLAAVLTRP